jgi:hypothetical protein
LQQNHLPDGILADKHLAIRKQIKQEDARAEEVGYEPGDTQALQTTERPH